MKRQKRNPGDIVSIPLPDGSRAFGRVLPEPLMAFYDLRSSDAPEPDIETIIKSPVLWRIWVMNHAVTRGRWRVIGNAPIDTGLLLTPTFFKQDSISGKLYLYKDQAESPASLEECEDVEAAAVWEPEHVESRLLDHFEGRPNKWVNSLRPKVMRGA